MKSLFTKKLMMKRVIRAVRSGDLAGLNKVLKKSRQQKIVLDLNVSVTQVNFTLLHEAAQSGYAGIVKALIDAGASPTVLTHACETPLALAAIGGHVGAVKRLLPPYVRFDVNDADIESKTPLHMAVESGSLETIELLIPLYPDLDLLNDEGQTPLHQAAEADRIDILTSLFAAGANIQSGCYSNHSTLYSKDITPLGLAAEFGNIEAAKLLIAAGAAVNITHADNGNTPLHRAAANGMTEIVELLIESGAEIDVMNEKGMTPNAAALDGGHSDILEVLSSPAVLARMYAQTVAVVPQLEHQFGGSADHLPSIPTPTP